MRKLNKYIVSGLVIASFSFGGVLGGSSQNVQAADSNQDRQKQLQEWQQKLTEWQKAQQSQQTKSTSDSSSSSSKTSSQTTAPSTSSTTTTTTTPTTSSALPNTGPGQIVSLFVLATLAGYVAHLTIRCQQLN